MPPSEEAAKKPGKLRILEGVLPINASQVPLDIIAGISLAALAIPEVMGYTKIAGMPVVTGLYTLLIPLALFAMFGLRATSWLGQILPPRRSLPLRS